MTLRKKQESIRDWDSVRRTTCCNCPAGCGVKVFLKNDKIVDIYGDEEHPINKGSFCPKGLMSYYHLTHPHRIIRPQIRQNLNEPFETVGWTEALSFTAKKIQDLSVKRGKESIFIYGDESATFDYFAGGSLFAKSFGTSNIPSRFLPYSFGSGGRINEMFGVPGSQLLMNPPRDWSSSKCILLYGSDLAASDPITMGHIIDARDRGATVLVIDSKTTITATKATSALRVKPGSQTVLLKGILHLLIQQGRVDENFLKEITIDFDCLKADVQPFTPQKVAKSCWVKQEDLEQMADQIGRRKPVKVIAGDWATQAYLSDEDLFMCGALVCLRGSIGIPGGGLDLLNASPFSWEGGIIDSEYKSKAENSTPVHFFLENILFDQVKDVGMLVWSGNPCAKMAEGQKTKTALKEIPFSVHLSTYPNETYHCSHVSFPMSSWLEYAGLVTNNNGRALQWHNKVIDPPGECRSSLDFWADLAQSCGIGEHFPWKRRDGGIDEEKAIDFFLKKNSITRAASVEKLDPERNPPGGLLWPCVEKEDLEFEENRYLVGAMGNVRGKNILFQKGRSYALSDKRFPTISGKISFSDRPGETPGEQETDNHRQENISDDRLEANDFKYPMILVSGILTDWINGLGYFVNDRKPWTPPMVVQMHPQIGKIFKVKNGEMIAIENDRGVVTAPVWLKRDLDPRVIWCPQGVDPYQPYFGCKSPLSLFEKPPPCSARKSFTMVTIYKAGQDKVTSQQALVTYLRAVESRL